MLRSVCLIPFTGVAFLAAGFNWGEPVGSVLELVMLQRYNDAYRMCDSVLALTPDDVDFHYVRLAVLQSQMSDYESYALDGQKCVSMAESVLVRVERKLAGNPPDDQKVRLNLIKASTGGTGNDKSENGRYVDGYQRCKDIVRSVPKTSEPYGAFPGCLLWNRAVRLLCG